MAIDPMMAPYPVPVAQEQTGWYPYVPPAEPLPVVPEVGINPMAPVMPTGTTLPKIETFERGLFEMGFSEVYPKLEYPTEEENMACLHTSSMPQPIGCLEFVGI